MRSYVPRLGGSIILVFQCGVSSDAQESLLLRVMGQLQIFSGIPNSADDLCCNHTTVKDWWLPNHRSWVIRSEPFTAIVKATVVP
jgi:hypothetical protein